MRGRLFGLHILSWGSVHAALCQFHMLLVTATPGAFPTTLSLATSTLTQACYPLYQASGSLVNVRQWRGVSPHPEDRCTFPVRRVTSGVRCVRAVDLLSHRARSGLVILHSLGTFLPPNLQTHPVLSVDSHQQLYLKGEAQASLKRQDHKWPILKMIGDSSFKEVGD